MTAGRLAASNPSATTNTLLYRSVIDQTASTVLTATNISGSGVTYRAALRNYDQILKLDGDEPSNLIFNKGNPVSTYKLKITPGISFAAASPNAEINSPSGSRAKLLDVYKDTATINRYVKVEKVANFEGDSQTLIGTFQNGETITGAVSTFSATLKQFESTTGLIYATIPDVASNATSVQISRNTGLAEGTKLMLSEDATATGTEVITIDTGGIDVNTNTLTVTRSVYGTTASPIPGGQYAKSFIDSATTSTINEGATYTAADVTLTLTDATGFLEGSFIRIGNEILSVTTVAGNDLTVVRGQYGTSAVDHTDGSAVTQMTDAGDYYLNFFTESEGLQGGTSNATISSNVTQGSNSITNQDRFTIAEGSIGGVYEYLTLSNHNNERTYRYDQSDSSNTGHPFRLSEQADGTQTLTGAEYTTGVTKVGTAGQAGAYLEITITSGTPLSLYSYAEPAVANTADANANYGFQIGTTLTPDYEEIYVYDVAGEPWAAAQAFEIGGTTYTVQANGVTVGKYGYVHEWNPTLNELKISLGVGSEAFAVGDQLYDTPTLVDANRTMAEVVSGKVLAIDTVGAANASRTAGTYSGLFPTGGSGSGLKVDIVVAASTGAATVTLVNGGKNYADGETLTVTDANLGGGGAPNLTFATDGIGAGDGIGATSTTYVKTEDYIHYGKAIAANSSDRTTGVVVGPGQNLIVWASDTNIAFQVQGFESVSEDYTVLGNAKTADSGQGGATP
tara:strand:+ start:3154 stop:5364 length:2211 start_codon:yes stop_codon:yes gene_type:complete